MNEYERQRAAYARTPAGAWQEAFGITEVRDLAAEQRFIEDRRLVRRTTYGRDLDEQEVRALEWAAERRTATVHQAMQVPSSSWEIAARLRWGVEAPPKVNADLQPLASTPGPLLGPLAGA